MSWMLSCIGCGSKKLAEKEETKVLDFQHYSLTAVPPFVFECERFLEELYLDFNQISELPRELFLCNELQILSLSDNDLHNLPPAISSLSNLGSLDLSKNGISDIPDNIKSCKRLHCVNASTNPLCRLPEGFTQLVSLKELSLSDTFLEYLPANFGRLSGLEVLDLRENQLNTLPRSMTRLTALKRLDLGQNEFTEMPEVVGHLTSLTDLWLDNNRIKRVPSEIGNLEKLSFLDASKNRISEIDSQFGGCKNLSDLYLTRNELEELPDSICQCTKLSTLHVDDNHLDHLPENFGLLDRLVELKSSQNELTCLPSSVGLLRNLKFLHVDENTLSTIPCELGSCVSLIVITAAHNQITELPAEMGSLPSLKVLNLCGNIIQSLPVSFSKLQLRALWLSENQAKPSVPLQCTNNASGQKVLTCFMLPQSQSQNPAPIEREDDRPVTEAEIEARRARSMIHFAADGDVKPSGRLTRVPTPYPKELRALAKHTKNILALKKEKEKEAPEGKNVSAVKDAEKLGSSSEKVSSLVTLKTSSSSVRVASNIVSKSAINSSLVEKEGSVPEKFASTLSEAKPAISSSEKVNSSPSCQNGVAPSPTPESEVAPTSSGKVIGRREMGKEYMKKVTTNHSMVQNANSKPQVSLPLYVVQSSESSSSSYPLPSGSPKVEASEEQPSSLRPASIAIAELSSPSKVTRDNYPQRPGSLALEGVMPPWQNQRPGSLAAPINTIGIPMASPTKRASSQNALHGISMKGTANFGEHWKPYHTPSRVVMKENFAPQVLMEKQEDMAERVSDAGVDILPAENTMDCSPLSASEVEALNEKNLSHCIQEKNETSSEVKLASTISKVTEEDYENILNPPSKHVSFDQKEKVREEGNKVHETATTSFNMSYQSHSDENYNHYQNENDSEVSAKCPSFIPWNPTTKIPKVSQFSPTSKGQQITPPKVPSYETTPSSKGPVMSPGASRIQSPKTFIVSPSSTSGIQSPSYPSNISASKTSILSLSGTSEIQPPLFFNSSSTSPKSSIISPSGPSKIQPPTYSSNISSFKSSVVSGIQTPSYSPNITSTKSSPLSPSGTSGIQPPYSSPKSPVISPSGTSGIQLPSYSFNISPSLKSPIISPSETSGIQPPSYSSNISSPSGTSGIQPPSYSNMSPSFKSPVISPSETSGIQPPSYSSNISSPSLKSPVISPSGTSGIQPPSYSSNISSPSLKSPVISPSGTSGIQPPSYSSNISSPSLKSPVISPSGTSGIQSPSYSSNISSSSLKSSAISPSGTSGIQSPSYSSNTSASKINLDKVKSSIPTLASPVAKEFHIESKSVDDRVRGKTPPKDSHRARTPPKETHFPGKEVVSIKGSSRIPMISSHSFEADTTEIPDRPNFVRSPSQTEGDSLIPVKKDHIPKLNPALSPTEKPINQTGIPILSPSEDSGDRSSTRIPTFSNSSLRGKKSGIPAPSERGVKHSGVKKAADYSS